MKPLSRCSFLAVVLSAIFAAPALGARHFPGPPQTPPAPTAAFTYTPASPRAGQPVAFNGTGSTCPDQPCSYVWSDDGGPVAPESVLWPLGAGETLSFTFSEAKTKYVRLTVTDVLGRSASVEHNVVVTTSGPPPSEPPPTEETSPPPTEETSPPPTEETSPPPTETSPPPTDTGERPACTRTTSSASAVSGDLGEGGVTCLTTGTYNLSEIYNLDPSSATLEPAPGATATLDSFTTENLHNITFRGLHLNGVHNEQQGSNLTFEENISKETECGYWFYAWEGNYKYENIHIVDNTMEDLNFTGAEGACTGEGVDIATASPAQANHFYIEGNTFGPRIADHYIQSGGDYITINGNTFLGPSLRKEHGSEDHQNIWQDWVTGEHLTFDNNVMEHTGTNGGSILLQQGQKKDVQIDNNLFGEDAEAYSVQIYPIEGLEFAHNTVVNSEWGVYFRAAESGDETHGDDYTVDYNVMVGNTGGTPDIAEYGCSSSCSWNHNVTSDGSATGEGSIDYWKPVWQALGSLFVPLGLPFEAGYRGP